jgi:hypothetical protein
MPNYLVVLGCNCLMAKSHIEILKKDIEVLREGSRGI